MSSFLKRVLIGGGLAVVGGLVGGPVLAAAAWKAGGLIATGNPMHLIPGGGLLADSTDLAASFTEVHGLDGWGRPDDIDVLGHRPMDGQGNDMGRYGNGEYPTDIWGRRS